MASIDYNDARFTNLEQEKQNALSQSNSTYDSLINQSGQYYDNLINQSKDWADKQADIQNQQTDFAIQKIFLAFWWRFAQNGLLFRGVSCILFYKRGQKSLSAKQGGKP